MQHSLFFLNTCCPHLVQSIWMYRLVPFPNGMELSGSRWIFYINVCVPQPYVPEACASLPWPSLQPCSGILVLLNEIDTALLYHTGFIFSVVPLLHFKNIYFNLFFCLCPSLFAALIVLLCSQLSVSPCLSYFHFSLWSSTLCWYLFSLTILFYSIECFLFSHPIFLLFYPLLLFALESFKSELEHL